MRARIGALSVGYDSARVADAAKAKMWDTERCAAKVEEAIADAADKVSVCPPPMPANEAERDLAETAARDWLLDAAEALASAAEQSSAAGTHDALCPNAEVALEDSRCAAVADALDVTPDSERAAVNTADVNLSRVTKLVTTSDDADARKIALVLELTGVVARPDKYDATEMEDSELADADTDAAMLDLAEKPYLKYVDTAAIPDTATTAGNKARAVTLMNAVASMLAPTRVVADADTFDIEPTLAVHVADVRITA